MEQAEQEGLALQKAISDRIRHLRLKKKWSLDRLSDVTGLSKSYLSQIENCEKNPPISTLTKIAFGLGEDVFTLITGAPKGSERPKFSIVRLAERQPIIHPGAPLGYTYDSITYKRPDRCMDGYVVTMGPDFPKEPFIHEGQELALALEGEHEFIYDGDATIVEPGDCLYFDSDRPHFSRSLGGRPAKILVVFSNPRRPI
ncbi:MAG: cupin domain-containing protein [Desulfobacteraceae bacterium]|jgi:transcriptional regulator with XRE-family HTH domain